jgi:ribosomal protein S14
MKETNCPLCFEDLETRLVARCDDCGADPKEIKHFEEKKHHYTEYEIFPGLNLTLCNFCDVDFGSYDPESFGLLKGTKIGFEKMKLIRSVQDPSLQKDNYCPNCGRRLSFLRFLMQSRENNAH